MADADRKGTVTHVTKFAHVTKFVTKFARSKLVEATLDTITTSTTLAVVSGRNRSVSENAKH